MDIHKNPLFLSILVAIEFLIIFLGSLYLFQNDPLIFQKKLPAVMVINLDGEIIGTQFFGTFEKQGQNRTNATSANNVIRMLEYFSTDESIKAFILEINSFGGQTAGQEELARYIKRMEKPVIAVVDGSALSSGYYVAASTDKIYAGISSKIGEIGKTFVYVNRIRNGQEQVCNITSSNYKNITINDCSGFGFILFERLRRYVEGTHYLLISHIGEMRRLPISDVESISWGAIFNGSRAIELGLVDEIGTTSDAVMWLERKLGPPLWIIHLRDLLPKQMK